MSGMGWCAMCERVSSPIKWIKHKVGNFPQCWTCRNKFANKTKFYVRNQLEKSEEEVRGVID